MWSSADKRTIVRPTVADDVEFIAEHMRSADRIECMAAALLSPADALRISLERSKESWVGTLDGLPAVTWGVVPGTVLGGGGTVWLLGATLIDRHPFRFLEACRECLPKTIEGYGRLSNYVDARNRVTLRWLRWLGFTVGEAVEYGALGRPFHKVEVVG